MSRHSIDSFIDSASKLLEAYPSTSTLTLTYANAHKKNSRHKKAEEDGNKNGNDKKAHNLVTFKCYEPHCGKCIKYTTFKSKELSRLMTFIGPRGVTTTRKKKRLSEDPENNSSKKPKTAVENSVTNGLASIMSNAKFDTEEQHLQKLETKTKSNIEEEPVPATVSNQPSSSSKNKKKKKKGKK